MRLWLRHLQCLGLPAQGGMVWDGEIKAELAEHRPQGQRGCDRQGRIVRLAATGDPWRDLSRGDRLVRKPNRQAPALAQGRIVVRPVGHPAPLTRDMVPAGSVGFERHGRISDIKRGTPTWANNPIHATRLEG